MIIDIHKFVEKFNLTNSEEMALNYIVNNLESSLKIGVRGVAKHCFASTSVVMNLSKKIGYKGFTDMIYRLEEMAKKETSCSLEKNSLCLNYNKDLVDKFYSLIDINKKKAIYFAGTGYSKLIANYMKDKMMSGGHFAMMCEYMEAVERPYDETPLLIVVSKSGETYAVLRLCERARKNNIPIVFFGGNESNSMANISKITFVIKNSNIMDDRNLDENDFFGNTILFFEKLFYDYKKTYKLLQFDKVTNRFSDV